MIPLRRRGWHHPAQGKSLLNCQAVSPPVHSSTECREKAGHLLPPRQVRMEPSLTLNPQESVWGESARIRRELLVPCLRASDLFPQSANSEIERHTLY